MSVPNVTSPKTADALGFFRSNAEIAELLGVTQPAVSHWRSAGRIPTKRALALHAHLSSTPGFDADGYLELIRREAAEAQAA